MWLSNPLDHLQDQLPNQDRRGVEQLAGNLVAGTKLCRNSRGSCVSQDRLQIKVADIVIGCSKSKEDAGEVVAIKLSAPVTTTLDTTRKPNNFRWERSGFVPK
jgi:hypothetical protein